MSESGKEGSTTGSVEEMEQLGFQDFEGFLRKAQNVPVIKHTDMTDEMKVDCIETVTSAIEICIEKNPKNLETAAKSIKESMDKKYGKTWAVVIGKGFGFSVAFELKNVMYLFYNGTLGVLVFKSV